MRWQGNGSGQEQEVSRARAAGGITGRWYAVERESMRTANRLASGGGGGREGRGGWDRCGGQRIIRASSSCTSCTARAGVSNYFLLFQVKAQGDQLLRRWHHDEKELHPRRIHPYGLQHENENESLRPGIAPCGTGNENEN
jgi:hypothetical protein